MAICEFCGDKIRWIRSLKDGKTKPFNRRKMTLTDEDGAQVSGYMSHFATCKSFKENMAQRKKEKDEAEKRAVEGDDW